MLGIVNGQDSKRYSYCTNLHFGWGGRCAPSIAALPLLESNFEKRELATVCIGDVVLEAVTHIIV
jgi:hypothetical protein